MTCSNGGFVNRVDTLTNHVAEEATRIFRVARSWIKKPINEKTSIKKTISYLNLFRKKNAFFIS